MNYTFKSSTPLEIDSLRQGYVASLSSPIDSFMEHHILTSQLYGIFSESQELVGYFAIHPSRKLLTQFYLQTAMLKAGQQIFTNILSQFPFEAALVPTCDELFLSHVLDQKINLKKQAYFFQDNKALPVDHKLYAGGTFRLATAADIPQIQAVCTDFFDHLEQQVARQEIFVLMEDDILLGAGLIEPGQLLKAYTSIGMVTNANFRQRGIGRTIIIHLKQWCYEHGQIPIAGCWYYNHNSKRTLESAGMFSQTRLLNVEFVRDVGISD